MTTATEDGLELRYDDPHLLPAAKEALTAQRRVVVRLTGPSAKRAANVFLGGDHRLYDGVRTVLFPGPMTGILSYTGLSDLARVIALGRLRGHRVDVEYVDATREFRLSLVPPPASARPGDGQARVPRPRRPSDLLHRPPVALDGGDALSG